MYTAPEWRGRGIARMIVEELMSAARAAGARFVSLRASDQGRPIYEKAGFAENPQVSAEDAMSKLELIRELYEYNRWANGVILDAAAAITEEQLASRQTASHESIQGLLVHTMGTQVFWLTRWKGEQLTSMPRVEEGRALESLRESFASSDAGLGEYIGGLSEDDLQRAIPMPEFIERMKGVDLELWQVMVQILQHGMHHRAEVQAALTAFGHPVRDLDYILWSIDRKRGG